MHALVTGCSSGIGAAVVARICGDGGSVTGLSRHPGPAADRFTPIEIDLAEPGPLAERVGAIGPVEAVVHCAGVQHTGRLGALARDAGELMWRLHVDAATRVVDAVVGGMPEGGRIVLLGSRTAVGAVGKSQYAATKAALIGLARSWAMELAPRRITVNVVAPGPTDTPMLAGPGRTDVPVVVPPLGRLVAPAEVADLIAFLLGPGGAMITGQHLVMCGGASL